MSEFTLSEVARGLDVSPAYTLDEAADAAGFEPALVQLFLARPAEA